MSLLVMEMQVSKNKDLWARTLEWGSKELGFPCELHVPNKLVQMWTSQIVSHFRLTEHVPKMQEKGIMTTSSK